MKYDAFIKHLTINKVYWKNNVKQKICSNTLQIVWSLIRNIIFIIVSKRAENIVV